MIRKHLIATLLLACNLTGFGQELPNEKTEKHQQITGTNIFMIPPKSFQTSNNFKGFQNPNDPTSMIMTVEIPGPYSEVAKGFNSDMLKTRGMDLKTKKELSVGGVNGLFMEVDQFANGMLFSKQIIVYGDKKSTTIINGVYLHDSLSLGERIKKSILTTVVDAEIKSNQRVGLGYTIDENVGSLKFKTVIGNTLLFNRDLKIPTESFDKATLMVGHSFSDEKIENKETFVISRVKKYPDNYSLLDKGIMAIKIDHLEGYELYAKNNNKENEEMYQVILFDENGGYYLFVGTYISGSEKAMSDIRNTILTFKRDK